MAYKAIKIKFEMNSMKISYLTHGGPVADEVLLALEAVSHLSHANIYVLGGLVDGSTFILYLFFHLYILQ